MTYPAFSAYNTTVSGQRLAYVSQAAVHTGGGLLAEILSDGNNNHFLWINGTSWQIQNGASPTFYVSNNCSLTLCRDVHDNVYVIGVDHANTTFIGGYAFTKAALSNTWTQQSAVWTASTIANNIGQLSATWVDTGGGTNNAGHILVIGADTNQSSFYAILDAGVLLAGTGTLLVSHGNNPTFLANASSTLANIVDIANDGFGATSGLAACSSAASYSAVYVGAWAVSNTGTLTTNSYVGLVSPGGASYRWRLINVGANLFALVGPGSSAGSFAVSAWSKTALLVNSVTYTGNSNFPSTSNEVVSQIACWDAFCDPVTAGRIWAVQCPQNNPGGATYALSCDITTGSVTWAAAGITEDSNNTDPFATTSAYLGTRVVRDPVNKYVDFRNFVQMAAGGTWEVMGDTISFDSTISISPTSPANGTTTGLDPTLTVQVSDADPSGSDTVTFTIATDAGLSQNVKTFQTAAQTLPLSSANFTALVREQLIDYLQGNAKYYWQATVNPSDGVGSVSTAVQSFTTIAGIVMLL